MTISINGSGTVAGVSAGGLPSGSPAPIASTVRLNTANGYGSTNTRVRRFSNIITTLGTDITYADSATLGATFTINTSGVYAISYSDNFSAVDATCITLNDSAPTTTPALGDLLALSASAAAGATIASAVTVYLSAGSVIRARSYNGSTTGSAICVFVITRVS